MAVSLLLGCVLYVARDIRERNRKRTRPNGTERNGTERNESCRCEDEKDDETRRRGRCQDDKTLRRQSYGEGQQQQQQQQIEQQGLFLV